MKNTLFFSLLFCTTGSALVQPEISIFCGSATDSNFSLPSSSFPVSSTLPPFDHLRFGTNFTYSFPMVSDTYFVTLDFIEPNAVAAGKRVFSVSINGQLVITDLDLFARGGRLSSLSLTFPVLHQTGNLVILFKSTVGNAVISKINIRSSRANGFPNFISGLTEEIPATCPTSLTFYVLTDPGTNRILWCSNLKGGWFELAYTGETGACSACIPLPSQWGYALYRKGPIAERPPICPSNFAFFLSSDVGPAGDKLFQCTTNGNWVPFDSYLAGQEDTKPACPGDSIFYSAKDTKKLFWCDGTTWRPLATQ